jgi:hypothetical protein
VNPVCRVILYLIFNSPLYSIVTSLEWPDRLQTYTEAQRIGYVVHVYVAQPFGARDKCPVGAAGEWNLRLHKEGH